MQPIAPIPRGQVVAELREQLRQLESGWHPVVDDRVSTQCEALDRLLGGGLGRGTLVEWLASGPGCGAYSLALAAACQACRDEGPLLIIEPESEHRFYPAAAALAGMDLAHTIFVRPTSAQDEAWVLDQAIRSTGVGAVLCQTTRLSQRALRRLQLAAEASAGLGLLIRPARARKEPSWAGVRLLVQAQPTRESDPCSMYRRLRVEVLKLRAGGEMRGATVELELNDETRVMRVAPALEPAANRVRRSAGA